MRSDPPSSASDPAPHAPRVLLVTAESETPPWAGGDGKPFDLRVVSTVEQASSWLSGRSADVVVVDSDVAEAGVRWLDRLREAVDSAALLVRTENFTPNIPDLLRRLGGASCVLPATAPAPMQAQLVSLAADRSRLGAILAERVAELEKRTHELEQSRSRFRDVIERNADAIVVVDREGVIRFANRMAAELFGRKRDDLVGTPFGFPLVLGETTELDLLYNGHARIVEMRVVESEWEAQPAFIASLRDVTERKRTEERARELIREQTARTAAEEAARRFRFLAEASTLLSLPLDDRETLSTLARLCVADFADWAVVYTLADGRVERHEVAHRDPDTAKEAETVREAPIDPDGPHPVLDVLRTRTPLLLPEVDDERLRSMAQDEGHLELLRRLGVASLMIVPLVARGRELGAIGLGSSRPERRFTERDLALAKDLALRAALAVDNVRLYHLAQRANQAKTDLLTVISHDLRTPLNSIMGHAELLSMGIPDTLSDAGLQRVERIRVSASHLLFLIDELLTFARLEGGRELLRPQEIDAREIAQEVAAVVESLAAERSLEVRLELPPEERLHLCTDPDRLRQVLINLAGNAVKYTEKGEVRLRLRRGPGDCVEFDVRDTGIGIPSEHLERIFEPFWQVDPARRAAGGGAGLGLSVVRRLVGLLGGEVYVESEVGCGSCFTVRLPHSPAEQE
jgi:signal transduction histidine kinase/PAS domain-containing protein